MVSRARGSLLATLGLAVALGSCSTNGGKNAGLSATELLTATTEVERAELWRVRRELSPSLRQIAALKFNHDVVVKMHSTIS